MYTCTNYMAYIIDNPTELYLRCTSHIPYIKLLCDATERTLVNNALERNT